MSCKLFRLDTHQFISAFTFVAFLVTGLFDAASAQGYQQPSYSNRVQQTVLRSAASSRRSAPTNSQRVAVPKARWTTLGHAPHVSGMRNGLPPTRIDSFVLNAGVYAEHIYGDEGTGCQPPPYDCFSEAHRINTGIRGERNIGLTTGHGSVLPDATGRDEFSGAPESSQSGARTVSYVEIPFKNEQVIDYAPEQFPDGYRTLDKENYYDEDRVRPASDPYDSGF